jgi:membrane protease YdiL (CAAX protease family)
VILSQVMHWDFIAILIVLGGLVPWLGRRRVHQLMLLPRTTKMDRLTLYASTIAFQWAAVIIILWRAMTRGIRPDQLGLSVRHPALTVSLSIVLGGLFFANQVFSVKKLASRSADLEGLLPQLALKVFPQDNMERLAFVALVSTVALCEEVIYRGFIQFIFQDVTGGVVLLGIVFSAIFFALAHFYQGTRGLLSTFVVGLLFATVRSWTGSLIPPISAHFVTDLTVGFLAPVRLRRNGSESSVATSSVRPNDSQSMGENQ